MITRPNLTPDEKDTKIRFLYKLREFLRGVDPYGSATLEGSFGDITLAYRDDDAEWHFIPLGPRVTAEEPK